MVGVGPDAAAELFRMNIYQSANQTASLLCCKLWNVLKDGGEGTILPGFLFIQTTCGFYLYIYRYLRAVAIARALSSYKGWCIYCIYATNNKNKQKLIYISG